MSSQHDKQPFNHLDAEGHARMIDVSAKEVTTRSATASAVVVVAPEVTTALAAGAVPKGDVFAVARLAGIQAAKQTQQLIPLAHPLAIHGVTVDLALEEGLVTITVRVVAKDRTGVEMEALTAASVAGLSVIDMVKGLDRSAHLGRVWVEEKRGGRSGTWTRDGV